MSREEIINSLCEYGEDKDDLQEIETEDLKRLLDDIEDTSDFHPNETYEEFVEHEDWEDDYCGDCMNDL